MYDTADGAGKNEEKRDRRVTGTFDTRTTIVDLWRVSCLRRPPTGAHDEDR
jgi:hypothetical protein